MAPIHCLSQTLFATALTFADGMLTRAVSVTSAVAGLGLSVPSLNNNISSISIGILVALFLPRDSELPNFLSSFRPVVSRTNQRVIK
jgi:KUP system potassium uptake protein